MTDTPNEKLPRHEDQEEQKSDLEALLDHIKLNPMQYAAGFAFVVVAVLLGVFWNTTAEAKRERHNTAIARALEQESADARSVELAEVVDQHGPSALSLRLLAEEAYEVEDYAKAKEAFERLCDAFPKSPYVPDALEGLGYIAENDGDYEQALENYHRIRDEYTDSFAAMRQPLNIARVYEQMNDFEAARQAYEDQVNLFPDSAVADTAADALARFRNAYPELFPKPAMPDEVIAPETGAPDADGAATQETVTESAEAVTIELPATDHESEASTETE